MSADNGVYVLKSPVHPDVGEFEYRVTHAMAIENINHRPDVEGFNTEQLKRYFGRRPVFFNRVEALVSADEIAQGCEILEYGIQFINLPFCFPEQTLGKEIVGGLRELSEVVAAGKPLSAKFEVKTVEIPKPRFYRLAEGPKLSEIESFDIIASPSYIYTIWVNPFRPGSIGLVAISIREFRSPKRGEWFLSGAIPEAWRAPNNLTTPYQILELVIVETKTVTTLVK